MFKSAKLVVSAVLLSTCQRASLPKPPVTVQFGAAGVAVDFPGEPSVEESELQTQLGPLVLHKEIWVSGGGEYFVQVGAFKDGRPVPERLGVLMLQSVCNGAGFSSSLQLTDGGEELGAHGRCAGLKDGKQMAIRCFVKNGHLVQLAAGVWQDTEYPTIHRFLESARSIDVPDIERRYRRSTAK